MSAPGAKVKGKVKAIGPVFVAGRQHSGNTVTTAVIGNAPECFPSKREGWFFERHASVDRMTDRAARPGAVTDLLRLEDGELAERVRVWLTDWHQSHPDATAVELYRAAMEHIVSSSGSRFWVQHATSYIFCAAEILELLPDARILYLVRNPYDVCASKKRRNPKRDRFWSWVLSWNHGLRIALALRERHPGRVMIARYEDIVTTPVETFNAIFEFVGIRFDESYLDVPHVNRSDAPGAKTSQTRGLNASRVNYYTGILTPAEIAAVDMLVARDKLAEYYPDLPTRPSSAPLATRLKGIVVLALSPVRHPVAQSRFLLRHNLMWRLRRGLQRLRIVLR